MSTLPALLAIAAALCVGAMSPGPSFLMVARTSLAVSRRAGLAAALGMGVGAVLFAALALVGLLALLAAVPALHLGLKLAGGAYLAWLGVQLWRGADAPLVDAADGPATAASLGRHFLLGLTTQVSNPKTAVVYASVFASLLPAAAPTGLVAALPPLVFAIEAGWYALVALALSAPGPRARYLAAKSLLDRGAGLLLGALGLRLLAEARHS